LGRVGVAEHGLQLAAVRLQPGRDRGQRKHPVQDGGGPGQVAAALEERIASMTGGPSGQAAAASSYTAAMSAADRVKLTTYRWQAAVPKRSCTQAIASNVASTSPVR